MSIVLNQAEKNLSQNARIILEKRYLRRDKDGNILETPDEMYWRVARHIAAGSKNFGVLDLEIGELAAQFYEMMAQGKEMKKKAAMMKKEMKKGETMKEGKMDQMDGMKK